MKLLLTSNGFANKSIVNALSELLDKPFDKTRLVFIPTAANAETGDKSWLINDLANCKKLGLARIDIVDIAALNRKQWEPRLNAADIIMFGGGNTFYLSYWMQKSGLFEVLPKFLKTKIYVGISAGSMMAGDSLTMTSQALENPEAFKDEDYDLLGPKGQSSGKSLKLVNFLIRPHLNSRPYSLLANKELLEKKAKEVKVPIYAIDDESAVKVVDGKAEVVSEGEFLILNN